MPDALDDLADVPPEDFVAARDDLAKRLKAAGNVAEAAEVKQVRKPTVTVWIAEQVRRHHGEVVAQLRAASATVATAQESLLTSGDRDALKTASTQRREALRGVGKVVEQVLARNGRPAHHKDEVVTAIESAVTGEVASGVFGLRDDLELPERRTSARDRDAQRRAEDEERRRDAEKARAAIDAAEARVERARDELAKAERNLAAVMERHGGVERDA